MSHSAVITEDTVIECKEPNLLAAIRKDDCEAFNEEVSNLDSINHKMQMYGTDTPWILINEPTVAQVCAFFGAVNCFQSIQDLGADLSIKDQNNRSLIHFAAAGGKIDILRLIDTKICDIKATDIEGNSPAHYAAKFGKNDVFNWLWTHGAEINARNNRGATPFFWACGNGNVELIKFLLEHKVSVKDKTEGVEYFLLELIFILIGEEFIMQRQKGMLML